MWSGRRLHVRWPLRDDSGIAKRSKVHPTHKARYFVTNWSSYDRALVKRGSLTLWLSPEAISTWKPDRTGRRGGQLRYSDLAVQTALHLRLLLHLPWRQTEGLLRLLMELMGSELAVPDHTTLSRRSRDLAADFPRSTSSRAVHLIVDASGLKVFGQGEWAAARYGCRPVGWRKLHLGVDQTGNMVAVELTGDGAYDRREVYEMAGRRGAYVVVPPQRGAMVSEDPTSRTRNRHIQRIARVGRAQWRREKKQHQQARAVTAFYRYKQSFGPAIRARHANAQRVEVVTAYNLLNWMSSLGTPVSQKLAA